MHDKSRIAACALGEKFVKMYKDTGCNGAYLSMIYNDAIPDMRTYGFNDAISAATVGYCVSGWTTYTNINYGGSTKTWGGGQYYSTLPGWGDTISSARTNRSAAC